MDNVIELSGRVYLIRCRVACKTGAESCEMVVNVAVVLGGNADVRTAIKVLDGLSGYSLEHSDLGVVSVTELKSVESAWVVDTIPTAGTLLLISQEMRR